MKNMFLTLILLLPAIAFSSVNYEGERVIYRLILDGRDQGVSITDVTNLNGEEFSLETQLYIEETEEIINSSMHESDISNSKELKELIKNCQNHNGKVERIYMAGRLSKTCKMSVDNPIAAEKLSHFPFYKGEYSSGYVWIGNAPIFGIVKVKSPELILDLTYYLWP